MCAVRLELGCPVDCSDGPFGELGDVVIDPTTRRVTHLVVQPHDRHDLARLVPVDWAKGGEPLEAAVHLDRTRAQLEKLEPIERAAYVRLGEFPVEDPDWDVGIEEVTAMPYYSSFAPGVSSGIGPSDLDPHMAINYDRIPKGEVEIRRGSVVVSSDGHDLGHVDGFIVDDEQHISGVVLEHGHLWGKKDVVIPIGAMAHLESDQVELSMTKDEVGALESVPVNRWHD